MRTFNVICWVVGMTGLSACATYTPQPLPQSPYSVNSVSALQSMASTALPLSNAVFDPANGLDSETLAMLAVANNPQLKADRAGLGVAQAQAFSAGLLADPRFGANQYNSMTPGALNAWDMGLGFDVSDWLMRSSREGVAKARLTQAEQQMLWQEWQVIAQARCLYVRVMTEQTTMALLEQEQKLLNQDQQANLRALQDRNVTAESENAASLALQSVESQRMSLQRAMRQSRADLNVLLGLSDNVTVTLRGEWNMPTVNLSQIRAELPELLVRRPDMLALRAAYQAHEFDYHAAVLGQFPSLSVGLTRAQDNFGDNSYGFGFNINLPIFNRNRGNIAVAKASRQQVYAEYQTRLNIANSEVSVALDNLPVLQTQLLRIQQMLPALQAQNVAAHNAFQAGNLALSDATRLQLMGLDKQIEMNQLKADVAAQQIAMLTLLGPHLPQGN